MDDESVREDIGYRRPTGAEVYRLKAQPYVQFTRIRFIRGMFKGETRRLNSEIAKELIRTRYAEEIKG